VRGLINDFARGLIGAAISGLSVALTALHWMRIGTVRRGHRRMLRRYDLTPGTPIQGWSASVERSLQQRAGSAARLALTSGAAACPKRVPYTERRLRSVRLAYVDMFVRGCRALRIRRRSLYVFSAFRPDDSVTALLVSERRAPWYLSTLQAPYRVQSHPAMRALASAYGPTALRLWILTIANPGVLYSTNPSTLSTFCDDLTDDWLRHAKLVRDYCERPGAFAREVHAIAGRLESRGSADRLGLVAASRSALPLHSFAPGVEAYICWTGGYVKPFLARLARHLPSERYRLIPMFSMATETIETVPHFDGAAVSFLPLARGVCYEFIEEGAEDRPGNLLTADRLQAGKAYAMVVSDRYGLRRYQTGDLFLCRGFCAGLPDLEFLRRRDMEYSFTGEKLTSDQLVLAFERLRAACSEIRPEDFLACVPSHPAGEPVPHYKVVLVLRVDDDRVVRDADIARLCDRLLGEINGEYQVKRDSGRLGAVRVVRMGPAELADRAGGPRGSWESQFKFLPLSRERWESGRGAPDKTTPALEPSNAISRTSTRA